MKIEAAETRLSAELGLSRRGRPCASQTKDCCARTPSDRDPVPDGGGLERVQGRCLRLV